MEENDEIFREIVFPVESMQKKASNECARMIWGGVGVFLLITVLNELFGSTTLYMIAAQIVSPLVAIAGIYCWLISLYNGTRAVQKVKANEDGFDINDDHFAFEDLKMDFVHGNFFGKVFNFNSMYLDVRSQGYKRKYWMGLYKDKTAYLIRDRLGKLIDHYEFDEKLINQG